MADIKKIKVQIGADNKELDRGMNKAEKSVNKFSGSVSKLGGVIAGAFSVAIIFRFSKALLSAADVQQKAETALLVALNGRRDVQQRLIKQAQDLQKFTLFGDEETIRAQGLIAAFVKEEEAIKRIIPLVQDMASAKGMQLANAADLVSKTLGSSTNAMSRYGIEVTGAVGSTERLTSLVDGLTKAFEGQAAAAAAVDLSFTQLQNRIGDIKEEMGVGLHKAIIFVADSFNKAFNPALSIANELMREFNEELVAQAEWKSKMAAVDERLSRLSFLKIEYLRKETGKLKEVKAEIISIQKLNESMDWALSPFGNFFNARGAKVSSQGRTQQAAEGVIAGIAGNMNMDIQDVTESAAELGNKIGVQLVMQFANLGDAIGRALAGAEDALTSLGQTILQNLGSILMMAGISTGNWGLVIAGAAIQLGSGIWRGMQGGQMTPSAVSGVNHNVTFTIKGRDLQGVLDRNGDYNLM